MDLSHFHHVEPKINLYCTFPRNQVKNKAQLTHNSVHVFDLIRSYALCRLHIFFTFPVSWSELPGWDGSSKLLWSGTSQKTTGNLELLMTVDGFNPCGKNISQRRSFSYGWQKYIYTYIYISNIYIIIFIHIHHIWNHQLEKFLLQSKSPNMTGTSP